METEVLFPTPEILQQVAQHLCSGGLAAIPTETVYGLAGNALDPEAVTQIFAVKERPKFDPLIVHVAQPASGSYLDTLEQELELIDISNFDTSERKQLQTLLQTLWPGPLTVVLPKTIRVPDLVTSGLPTVAIRMPRHPIAQELLHIAQIPLAAPSANRFGRISPTSAQAVFSEINGRIPYILDGGECEIGLESTVIAIQTQGITILRPGGISMEQLRQIFTLPICLPQTSSDLPHSPGQLPSHYAPGKPFVMLPDRLIQLSLAQVQEILGQFPPFTELGILAFSQDSDPVIAQLQEQLGTRIQREVLSPTGDLREAARTLFAKLRQLDQSSADLLLTEPCPATQGLGYAIMDRLRRATVKQEP